MTTNIEPRWKFSLFDLVEKISGYRFPGKIVSRFTTSRGQERYVVECNAEGVDGCLHIFNPEQLKKR